MKEADNNQGRFKIVEAVSGFQSKHFFLRWGIVRQKESWIDCVSHSLGARNKHQSMNQQRIKDMWITPREFQGQKYPVCQIRQGIFLQ